MENAQYVSDIFNPGCTNVYRLALVLRESAQNEGKFELCFPCRRLLGRTVSGRRSSGWVRLSTNEVSYFPSPYPLASHALSSSRLRRRWKGLSRNLRAGRRCRVSLPGPHRRSTLNRKASSYRTPFPSRSPSYEPLCAAAAARRCAVGSHPAHLVRRGLIFSGIRGGEPQEPVRLFDGACPARAKCVLLRVPF